MPATNTRVVEVKITFIVNGTTNNADAVSAEEEALSPVLNKEYRTQRSGYPVSARPQNNASSITVSVR